MPDSATPTQPIQIGDKISKQFDGIWFEGIVDEHVPQEGLWHVTFSNGDGEDFDTEEVMEHRENYNLQLLGAVSHLPKTVSEAYEDKSWREALLKEVQGLKTQGVFGTSPRQENRREEKRGETKRSGAKRREEKRREKNRTE